MIYSIEKPSEKLCNGLMVSEFKCKCGLPHCRNMIIEDYFLYNFEKFRTLMGLPLHITSGYRCSFHNHTIGGKPLSQHLLGAAIDIDYFSLQNHYNINEIERKAYQAGFTYFKFYPDKLFFHIDIRKE